MDVEELGADLLTVVGHKFGAPKGVAALYIRSGVRLARFLHGGGQARLGQCIWSAPLVCQGMQVAHTYDQHCRLWHQCAIMRFTWSPCVPAAKCHVVSVLPWLTM